ncbi:MAG TPA: T9SS type A sorting domain-containing protein [Xanthomarina sp.]|nr:T9SS type A sorting domain-containing protein [Xanthomarina sp.]
MQPTTLSIFRFLSPVIFVLIILNTNKGYCQTTLIPDPNFEQALIDLNIDTNGLNGNILNSDASVVYYLNVSQNFISDLTGIEAFTNLKTLDCSANNLVGLDVSQNTKLYELNADDNQIANIDLSLNTKLKWVWLSSNSLSSIDVSNNLLLEELGVNLNYLTELEVSNNINLEHLGCYSNNLTNIDLSNNSALKVLHIGVNNLNTLDVSQNTSLQTLTCNENNLTELSVDTNSQLNYFDCRDNHISNLNISNAPELVRLFVSNNNLNEVDLSASPNLKLFYAINNNLQTLDISGNSVLRWIKCDDNNLSFVDFRNGNNGYISEFKMLQNNNLSCILVDDSNASFLTNWSVDEDCSFVESNFDCEALSVKNPSLLEVEMYPNPALDTVVITVKTNEAKLELYTVSGQRIYLKILNQGINNIDLTNVSSGMYIAQISYGQAIETKKLIIK